MGIIKPFPVDLEKEFNNVSANSNAAVLVTSFDPDEADSLTIRDIHFTNVSKTKNITFNAYKQFPNGEFANNYFIKEQTVQKTDEADRNFLTWNDPIALTAYKINVYVQIVKPTGLPSGDVAIHWNGFMSERTL